MRELREEDWAELIREELDSYSPKRLPRRFQPRRGPAPARWPVAAAAVAALFIVGLSIVSASQPRVVTGVFSGVFGRHEQVSPAPATPTSNPSASRSPGAGGPSAGAAPPPASVAPAAPAVTANPAAPPAAAPAPQPSGGGGQPLPLPV